MEKQVIYEQTASTLRHYEKLIYESTAPYFAIAAPLFAIIFGFGNPSIQIQIMACLFGLIFSIVWWVSVERARRYFMSYMERLAIMEEGSDFTLYKYDIEVLPKDNFLKFTPRSTRIRSFLHIAGCFIFFVLLLFRSHALP